METLRLDRIYLETFFISVELLHKSYSLFFSVGIQLPRERWTQFKRGGGMRGGRREAGGVRYQLENTFSLKRATRSQVKRHNIAFRAVNLFPRDIEKAIL